MERKTYTLNGKQFTWHSVDVDYGDAWEDEQGNELEPEAVTWRVLQAMNVSVEETGKIDKDYILDMLQDDADEILNNLQHLARNEIGMTEEEARAYQAWKEALVAKDAYSITSADKERMAAAQDAYYAAYNESCARPEVQQRHQELLADEVGPYAVTLKAIEVIRDAHMEYLPEHDAEKNNIDQESNPQTGKATCVPTPTPFKSRIEKNIESNMAIARARQQEKIAKDARDQDAKNLALLNNIAQRQIQLKKRELGLVINRTNPLQENPAEGDSPVLFDGRTVASADLRDLESIQGNNMRLLAAEMILDNARRSHSYEADMRVTESGGPETLLARAKAWHETTAKPVLKGKNNTRLYRGNGGDHLIGRIGDDFVVVYSVARAAKPNFLRVEKPEMVSSSGGQIFWKEIGYGNAINHTANRTPVFFDTLAFDTQSTGITYARIPKSVSIDEDLHYNLGFREARVPRPEPADKNEVADAPKPEDTDTQKARASALPRMEM